MSRHSSTERSNCSRSEKKTRPYIGFVALTTRLVKSRMDFTGLG